MFTFFKRSFYVLSNTLRQRRQPGELMKEKWIADFSKPQTSCFDIKPEISYNAYLEKGSLFLALKKKNCMAWLETASRTYVDQVIEARLRFSCPEGYCATGIMFRINGRGTYYLVFISNKGYFRFDAINNNIPKPLVGWTEIPGLNEQEVTLGIIAREDHFIFTINNKWIAEAYDTSIPGGHLGFTLVSYEADQSEKNIDDMYFPPELLSSTTKEVYICQAWLDYLSVDSRAGVVETEYEKWRDNVAINAESRLRLAESFLALNHFGAAHDQILKAWKQRERVIQSVTAAYSEVRTRGELLFAAQMASRIGQYAAAGEYIDTCLAMEPGNTERFNLLAEKTKILNAQNKYGDLVDFLPDYIKQLDATVQQTDVASLYALLGHAYWNLQDYKAAASAWDKAFNVNKTNGLYAANAANAYEMIGKNKEAFQRRLDGGKCFLQQKDYAELGALVSKLLAAGNDTEEAHLLAGEWAYGIGNVEQAKAELALAAELNKKAAAKAKPKTAEKKTVKKQEEKAPSSPVKRTRTKPKPEELA